MHVLQPFDEFFLYDEAPNKLANVCGLFRFEKFKFEDMKTFFYEEFCMKAPKAKTILTQIFGRYYWLELTQEKFDCLFPQICFQVTGVHDKKALEDKMVEWVNTELDLYTNVPYRLIIIDDYSEKESLVIFLESHAFTDGISLFSLFAVIDSNKANNRMPEVKGLTNRQQIVASIMKPIFLIYMGIKVLLMKRDRSVIKNNKGKPFKKRCLISPDYDVNQFKE